MRKYLIAAAALTLAYVGFANAEEAVYDMSNNGDSSYIVDCANLPGDEAMSVVRLCNAYLDPKHELFENGGEVELLNADDLADMKKRFIPRAEAIFGKSGSNVSPFFRDVTNSMNKQPNDGSISLFGGMMVQNGIPLLSMPAFAKSEDWYFMQNGCEKWSYDGLKSAADQLAKNTGDNDPDVTTSYHVKGGFISVEMTATHGYHNNLVTTIAFFNNEKACKQLLPSGHNGL